MTPQVRVGIVGLVLLLGMAVGWSLHARQFNRAQTVWMDSVKVAHVRTDMALQDSRKAKAEADSLRTLARLAGAEARAAEAVRQQLRVASTQAHQALSAARSTGDSLRLAVELVNAVETERDTALAASDAWHRAYEQEFRAANALAVRGDSLERVVVRQDSLLQRGLKVVGSSGCRIPILGLRCPEVVAGYGVTGEVTGGTVTIHRGVAVTVGWRVL